jgi:hypothetical protein
LRMYASCFQASLDCQRATAIAPYPVTFDEAKIRTSLS